MREVKVIYTGEIERNKYFYSNEQDLYIDDDKLESIFSEYVGRKI